ncbi:hypothetical protein MAPG_11539 [Magnaporthiopsis poae ATCC 64411]|uniref:Peptidase C14 caspase domain-containing protein n=1 Tax=Magnaporthiopsis poae (strain ATCC 64411 / 73-15) TaxID=644358 RepID=A0A0C4EFI9_MAGP6|nr:hypothetical protein MAPG_11539 [Magnaporthiopsis poae ATCC 64411]
MKMDPNNIKLLLAPVETEGRDDVPSYAKRNHLVFVHYSGHGGQATTVFATLKKKSSDAVDHSLMPADVARTGRYLRDGRAVPTVVLDCCHSGGAIRGDEEDLARIPGEAMVCRSHQTIDRELAPASEDSIASWGSVPLWMDEPKGFVMLVACPDYQKAKERREILRGDDGSSSKVREFWHGHLTYGLPDTLRTRAPGLSSTATYERLRAKVQNADQTPYLVGDNDRFFFGPAHRPRVYAVPVQSVEKQKKRVTLAGGRFHRVRRGAEYLIMPLNFELDRRVHTKMCWLG